MRGISRGIREIGRLLFFFFYSAIHTRCGSGYNLIGVETRAIRRSDFSGVRRVWRHNAMIREVTKIYTNFVNERVN